MSDRTNIDEVERQAALYAFGALPPEEKEAFGRRLAAGCTLCTAEVEQCDLILSALSLAVPQVTPAPELRTRLLESVAGNRKASPRNDQITVVRSGETPWRSSPYHGVEVRYLHKRKTMLVRMAAKSQIPTHPHATAEQCLVLEGSVESDGVTANAGDFIYMPEGSTHAEVHSNEGALLLIAYA